MVTYLISFVVSPWLFTNITKSIEIDDYESQIEAEQSAQEEQSTQGNDENLKSNDNNQMSDMMTNLVNVAVSISRYTGIVICIWGVFRSPSEKPRLFNCRDESVKQLK